MRRIRIRQKIVGCVLIFILLNAPACRNVDEFPRVDFTIDLADPTYSDLTLTGGYMYFNNVIVFRGLDQNYYALSEICTYDATPVQYQVAYNEIVCPSDQSHWDIYGNVTLGPAQQPLYVYMTSLSGTILRIYSN